MQIPNSAILPIRYMAAVFNNTTASYKFYWLLSIIESVEQGKTTILKEELFAQMLAQAWYSINYFHISFGNLDLIEKSIKNLKDIENIDIDLDRKKIIKKIIESDNQETKKILWHFDKNVPHWFLTPWFPKSDKAKIYEQSQQFGNQTLYALFKEEIIINPIWVAYLQNNIAILKGFCYWNLSLFLQLKNPNVPDIPNKLIKPATRNGLTKQRNYFWNIVLEEVGSVSCIYTGEKIYRHSKYAIEHFIPYAFVSHDLIWNLIPAQSAFNSKKSDKLPPLDKYFDDFFNLQNIAFQIIKDKSPDNILLQDYLSIFPNLEINKEKFRNVLQPLITIANNNGFEFLT